MKVKEFKLLETQYDVDNSNNNKIIITGFYDYITEEIYTPEQILELEGEIALLVNLYNPVVHHFHNLCKSKGYEISTSGKKVLYIDGRKPTRRYRFAACYGSFRQDGPRSCYACEINKPRTSQTNIIVLIDSAKWFRSDFNGFNVPTDGRAKQLYSVFDYALKARDYELSKTLAAQAREEMLFPILSVSGDQKEMRLNLVQEIRSAYVSGHNYLRNTQRQPFLYYCDVNSMYVYCLSNFIFPSLIVPPKRINHFVEPNSEQLAIYHIQSIQADVKPKHFPTIFSGTTMSKQLEIKDHYHLNIECMKPTKGWITSVDYEMLLRDYDIKKLDIDITLLYNKEADVSRELRAKHLLEFYNNKRNAVKGTPEYDYHKMLLNTFTGSLSIINTMQYSHEDLIEKGNTSLLRKDDKIPNIEISAFMTAYARKYITELALLAGFDNVHCISTDAVVVEDYTVLRPFLGNDLGQLKMDELRNARWWRVNAYEWFDEDGNWKTKASGISDGTYSQGENTACQPLLILDKEKGFYCKIYRTIKLSESIYEE